MTRLPRFAAFGRSLVILVVLVLTSFAAPVHAQTLKPWAPASDTLLQLVSTAKVRFQRQQADTISDYNYEAYDLVAQAGRRLLRALGRQHLLQAPAIEATLDSLGLDVEVANDPQLPAIVFMLVRNPYRASSQAVGYLYWFRGKELRMQGVSFPPSRRFVVHSWWSGRFGSPYEAGLVFRRRTQPDSLGFRLLRMSGDGNYWSLIDYEEHGPRMGGDATANFADINGDEQPELLVFQTEEPDSFLSAPRRNGVPGLIAEYQYTERPEGFVLHDARPVQTVTAVLRLFVLTLLRGDRDASRRMLLHPDKLEEAYAQGWNKASARNAWEVEYGEPDQAWPEWLEVKIHANGEAKKWIFHFVISDDGRWIVRDWIPVEAAKPAPPHGTPGIGAPSDSTKVRKP